MSTKHTPGPWRVNAGNETEIMAARFNVARAHCGGAYGIKLPEAESNARLIAAAPDLLACAELLDGLCAWLLHCHGPDSPEGKEAQFRLTAARAAIEKATGQ